MNQKYLAAGLLFFLCAFFALPARTGAMGTFVTDKYFAPVPAENQAIIYFDGETETLIANQTFDYDPSKIWQFYWLIPTPREAQAQIIQGDVFAKLDALLDPESVPDTSRTIEANLMFARSFAPELGATTLRTDLYGLGFYPSKKLEPLIADYSRRGWHMTAVLVDGTHLPNSMSVTRVHTMPLRLSFKTGAATYPMKFTSASDADLDFEAYRDIAPQFLALDENEPASLYARADDGFKKIRTTLYVISSAGADIDGFTKTGETLLDGSAFGKSAWNSFALDLPPKILRLQKFEGISKMEDLDDVMVRYAEPNVLTASLLQLGDRFGAFRGGFATAGSVVVLVVLVFLNRKRSPAARIKEWAVTTITSSVFLRRNSGRLGIAATLIVIVSISFLARPQERAMRGVASLGAAGMAHRSPAMQEIAMTSGNYFFLPDTITVLSEESAVLHIRADSNHNFTIDELGVAVATPDGTTTDVIFTPVKRGIYTYYCSLPGHRAAGHIGTLIVR